MLCCNKYVGSPFYNEPFTFNYNNRVVINVGTRKRTNRWTHTI